MKNKIIIIIFFVLSTKIFSQNFFKRNTSVNVLENGQYFNLPFAGGINSAQFSEIVNWKNPFKGVRYKDQKKNLIFFGSIDDVWFDTENNNYICVILKSTSKNQTLQTTNIWEGYWKHLSYYSYLLQKNNIKTSRNGLIFYINTRQPNGGQSKIHFEFHLFERILDFTWIEECFLNIHDTLNSNIIPKFTSNCKFCNYVKNINASQNEKS